jgi:SMODS-associating 4TM effector domain
LVKGAELSEYLITVLLPSLPAFLDAIENVDAHSDAANRRIALSTTIKGLISGGEAEETQLRDVQDELFRLRCEYTHVPESFYRWIKADYERDMRFGAGQTSAEAQKRDEGN